MYSSLSESKCLLLIPTLTVVITQLLLVVSASSLNMTNSYLNHTCLIKQGKYKRGSQHEEYLNDIIYKFSKGKSFGGGYGMIYIGAEPDRVGVTYQCRRDSYGPKCRKCFLTAQSELRKRCPEYKGGLIWYDQCLVEFSTIDTQGQINYDDSLCMDNGKYDNSDGSGFTTKLTLLDNLTVVATEETDPKYVKPGLYAAGDRRFGKKTRLYGMMQCIGDLSLMGCQECMFHNMVAFQDCFKTTAGARFLGRSCSFRLELYPFINPKTIPNYVRY